MTLLTGVFVGLVAMVIVLIVVLMWMDHTYRKRRAGLGAPTYVRRPRTRPSADPLLWTENTPRPTDPRPGSDRPDDRRPGR